MTWDGRSGGSLLSRGKNTRRYIYIGWLELVSIIKFHAMVEIHHHSVWVEFPEDNWRNAPITDELWQEQEKHIDNRDHRWCFIPIQRVFMISSERFTSDCPSLHCPSDQLDKKSMCWIPSRVSSNQLTHNLSAHGSVQSDKGLAYMVHHQNCDGYIHEGTSNSPHELCGKL